MPTVLRDGPYRFYWYSHEPDEPPHIHVDRDNRSAKFWLQPVALARNLGFPAHELRQIRTLARIIHETDYCDAANTRICGVSLGHESSTYCQVRLRFVRSCNTTATGTGSISRRRLMNNTG
ncbi:MAG: hypothetical protein Tsb0027_04130 [Wenzhouxiangellaceae bacterium]